MRTPIFWPAVLGSVLSCAMCFAQTPDSTTVKINQIQVIGTHNSYHAGIAPSEAKLWRANYPDAYKGLDYKHQPLAQQFDSGVRQIELDIYADTRGGVSTHIPPDLPTSQPPGFPPIHRLIPMA